jgi:hypothetical protein
MPAKIGYVAFGAITLCCRWMRLQWRHSPAYRRFGLVVVMLLLLSVCGLQIRVLHEYRIAWGAHRASMRLAFPEHEQGGIPAVSQNAPVHIEVTASGDFLVRR